MYGRAFIQFCISLYSKSLFCNGASKPANGIIAGLFRFPRVLSKIQNYTRPWALEELSSKQIKITGAIELFDQVLKPYSICKCLLYTPKGVLEDPENNAFK